jgi:fructose-bisphosphate aldolase class II
MFDILAEIEMKLGEFPLVLHGASEIQKQYIDRINRCGGAVNDYGGVPAEELKRAAKTNVAKINVASDGWIAATAAVREVLAETPGLTDPRKFLLKARKEMAELYIYKITEIMDSGRK